MASASAELIAFLLVISGWVLVSSTLPTDYWKVSSIDGTVITTATFWANLWKTCVTDSTGVSNCKDFPSMLALDGYIQACRGLMIAAVCLGFFGSVFALVGMKCTKVGGSDQTKAKIACLAGLIFILCGLSALTGCSLYANRITSEFFDPTFIAQKYELGAALFIGWAGASLCIIGGSIFCFSIAENNKIPRCSPDVLDFNSHQPQSTWDDEKYRSKYLEGTELGKMGYAYNRAGSVVSTRTKAYNSSADFKTSKAPPKHFDKNAYV